MNYIIKKNKLVSGFILPSLSELILLVILYFLFFVVFNVTIAKEVS